DLAAVEAEGRSRLTERVRRQAERQAEAARAGAREGEGADRAGGVGERDRAPVHREVGDALLERAERDADAVGARVEGGAARYGERGAQLRGVAPRCHRRAQLLELALAGEGVVHLGHDEVLVVVAAVAARAVCVAAERDVPLALGGDRLEGAPVVEAGGHPRAALPPRPLPPPRACLPVACAAP